MTRHRTIVFPLYPEVTQLDFTAPFEVFRRVPGAECVLGSIDGGSLALGQGLTFADLKQLSQIHECWLLCVPGGLGCVAMLENQQYLRELRRLASSAEFVTSVCTGSLLLAAAGLLAGKRAASLGVARLAPRLRGRARCWAHRARRQRHHGRRRHRGHRLGDRSRS